VCLLRGTDWIFIYNSTFCPHSVFVCFVWIWEQTVIISLYSINWLVFITETGCVYCAVRTGSFIYNSTFCPHSVFMCFVWIWEQTVIISLYSINWLVFITETECVYCAVRTGSLNNTDIFVPKRWNVDLNDKYQGQAALSILRTDSRNGAEREKEIAKIIRAT